MFVNRFMTGFRKTYLLGNREKRIGSRVDGVDMVTKQVRQVLQTADQKLILMVRN